MKSRRRSVSTWAFLAALAVLGPPAARAEKIRNHFDADSIMRPPGFFDLTFFGPETKVRWFVLTDLNPPSAPNRLVQTETQRPDGSIAVALRRTYAFRDGSASTMIKQGTGHAGLLVRVVDDKNYVLLMVNTATGELVLSSTVAGKTAELGRGQAPFSRLWQKFGITAAGPALTVLVDDQKVFAAGDPKPSSGRVGLATSGPGEVSFDELVLEPADAQSPSSGP